MKEVFSQLPKNIPSKGWLSDPTPAMPDEYKASNAIQSYRNYYVGDKKRFAKYTHRETPEFMQ